MKRVLHVISQRPSDTGSGVYLQNLIENGLTNVDQAIVFAANKEDVINVDIPTKWQYEIRFETDDLPFSVVGMSDVMPYKSSVFSKLDTEESSFLINSYKNIVKKAILDFEPDIILSQHLWILTAITKSVIDELELSIPIYGFCHGTDLRQLSLSKEYSEMVVSGCRKLNGVFALNDFQCGKIEKLYSYNKSKIHVLGNGYNSDYFYNNKDKNKKNKTKQRIIYAGKISYSKGIKSLIRAFNLIDDSELELYIAGSGHGEEYIDILNDIDKSDNIYYLQKLSQYELGNEFRKSDIFVLPSFYEGLPLVVIEAIVCGLKVVCTNISGVSEWINNYTGDSNVISFVELPLMIEIDKPDPDDVFDFENRLATSILEISNVDVIDFDYEPLYKLKWKEIFAKLNEIL